METNNSPMKRLRLAQFIASHGFNATPNADGSVTFGIPYSKNGQHAGFEFYTVSTLSEARAALGY
jgi:hypothetical protein